MNFLLGATSLVVLPLVIGASVVLWALARAAGYQSRAEERWVTVERNTCPKCGRVETVGHRPYDSDLGWAYDCHSDPCLSCVAMGGTAVELDFDSPTFMRDVRRLAPRDEIQPPSAA